MRYNLYSSEIITLVPHTRALVPTDITIQVPISTYARIATSSGLVAKFSINLSVGVIDADYRGHVKVLFMNYFNKKFKVTTKDRFTHLILAQIKNSEIK